MSKKCPSYLKMIGYNSSLLADKKGKGTLIYLYEQCIYSKHRAFAKNAINQVQECKYPEIQGPISQAQEGALQFNSAQKELIDHGTRVASIINGRYTECHEQYAPFRKLTPTKFLCGIAPKAKINAKFSNDISVTFGEFTHKFPDVENYTPCNKVRNKEQCKKIPTIKYSNIAVWSYSASSDTTTQNLQATNTQLRLLCEKNAIAVVSVGNMAEDLRIHPRLPASASLPTECKYDPLVRVGALMFDSEGVPQIQRHDIIINNKQTVQGSNYGSGKVDILAPGHEILSAVPPITAEHSPEKQHFVWLHVSDHNQKEGNKACDSEVAGVSYAVPIIAGLMALMQECNKGITPQSLRNSILDNADQYEHLNDFVTNGRVVNITRTLRSVCYNINEDSIATSGNTEPANEDL